jgi:hypothetical protein
MKVDLNKEKSIIIVPEQTRMVSSLTVERVVDLPKEKTIFAFLNEVNQRVDLWVGDEYDQIGQWTDDDVIKKIKEIFGFHLSIFHLSIFSQISKKKHKCFTSILLIDY